MGFEHQSLENHINFVCHVPDQNLRTILIRVSLIYNIRPFSVKLPVQSMREPFTVSHPLLESELRLELQ